MSLLTTASFRAAGLGLREDDEQRRASFDRQAKSSLPKPPELKVNAPKPRQSLVSQADEKTILRKTGEAALDGVGALGNLLDLPGSVARDLLTFLPGGPAPENPFDQLLSPTKSTGRVYGEDFLRDYGLQDEDTGAFAKFAGGLVFDVLADPLTYLTGGLTSVVKGGGKGAVASRSLKKVGLLDNIDVYTGLGKREAALKKSAKDILDSDVLTKSAKTDADKVAIRSKFDEELTGAIKQDKSFKKQAKGLSDEAQAKLIDDIKSSTLSDSYYRFKVPGFKEARFGGVRRAKVQDKIGEVARYNPATVAATSRLSRTYQDLNSAELQKTKRKFAVETKGATELARKKMHQNVKDLSPLLRFDDLDDEAAKAASNQVGIIMSRYMEDVDRARAFDVDELGNEIPRSVFEESRDELFAETREEYRDRFLSELKERADDPGSEITQDTYQRVSAALTPRPGMEPVLDDIKDLLDEVVVEAPQYGNDLSQLQDSVISYLPRMRQTTRGTIGRSSTAKAFDPENPFAMRREETYRGIPGGTGAINQMSIDEEFAGVTSKKALNAVKENSLEYDELFKRFKEKYKEDLPQAPVDALSEEAAKEAELKTRDLFNAITKRDLEDVKRGVTLFSVDPGSTVTRALESAYSTRVKRDMIRDVMDAQMAVDPTTSGRFSTKMRTLGKAFLPEDSEVVDNIAGMADQLGKRLAAALGKTEEDVTKRFKFRGADDAGGTAPPPSSVDSPPGGTGAPPDPVTPVTPDPPVTPPSAPNPRDLVDVLTGGNLDDLLQQIADSERGAFSKVVDDLSQAERKALRDTVDPDKKIKLRGKGRTGLTIGADIFDLAVAKRSGKKASDVVTESADEVAVRTGPLSIEELLEFRDPSRSAQSILDTSGFLRVGKDSGIIPFTIRIPNQTLDDMRAANVGGLSKVPDPKQVELNDASLNETLGAFRAQAHVRPAEVVGEGLTEDGMYIFRDANNDTIAVPSTFVDTIRSLHGEDVAFHITDPVRGGSRNKSLSAFKDGFIGNVDGRKVKSAADELGETPKKTSSQATVDARFSDDKILGAAYQEHKSLVDELPIGDIDEGSMVEMLRVGQLLKFPSELRAESIRYIVENKPEYINALKKGLTEAEGDDAAVLLKAINDAVKLDDGSILSEVAKKTQSSSPYRDRVLLGLSRTFGDEEASTTLAVFDATAKAFARATGRNADEFYAGIDDVADMSKRRDVSGLDQNNAVRDDIRKYLDEVDASDGIVAMIPASKKALAKRIGVVASGDDTPMDFIEKLRKAYQDGTDVEDFTARGSIVFSKDGKASIYGGKNADVTTALHEMTHYARRVLSEVDDEFDRLVSEAVGNRGGTFTVEQEEVFARGFEKFLSEGESPIPELDSVYARIKQWISDVYEGLKGTPLEEKITPELRAAYKRMQGAIDEAPKKKKKASAKKRKYSKRHQSLAKALGLRVNQIKKDQLNDIEAALEDARSTLDEVQNDDRIVFELFRGLDRSDEVKREIARIQAQLRDDSLDPTKRSQIEASLEANKKFLRNVRFNQRENVTRALLKAIDMADLDPASRAVMDAFPGFDELISEARTLFPTVFKSRFGDDFDAEKQDLETLWEIMTSYASRVKMKKSGNRYFNLNTRDKVLDLTDERVVERANEMNLIDPILNPPKPDPFAFGPELEDADEMFQAARGGVERTVTNEAGEAVVQVNMPARKFMEEEGDVVVRALRQPTPEELAKTIGRIYSDYILDINPKLEKQARALYGVRNGNWGTLHTRDGVTKSAREWLSEDFVKYASGDIRPPTMMGEYFDGLKRTVASLVGKELDVPMNRQVGQFLNDVVGSDYQGQMQTVYDVMRNLENAGASEQRAMIELLANDEIHQATRNALRIRVEKRQNYLLNEGGLDEMAQKIEQAKIDAASADLDEDSIKQVVRRIRGMERSLKKAEDLVQKTPDQWLDDYEAARQSTLPRDIDGVSTEVSDAGRLKQVRIPSWMANDLHRIGLNASRLEDLEDIGWLMKFVDNYTSIFKTSVTALHPGFHIRNFTSGFIHNILNDVHDPRFAVGNPKRHTQHYTDARQMMYGKQIGGANEIPGMDKLSDKEATERLAEELFVHEVIEQPGTYRDMPGQQPSSIYSQIIGPGQSGGEMDSIFDFVRERLSPLPPVTGAAKQSQTKSRNAIDSLKSYWSSISETGRGIGDAVEFQHRVGGYVALRRQGYSAAEAANRINMLHVDYSNLSRAEKDYLRRAIPFYSFSRGMAKYLTKELIERPTGPVGTSIRAQNLSRDKDVATPTYVSKGLSIPIGKNEDGTRHYLTGLGLMHEQPVQQLSPLLSGDAGKAGFSLISNANPIYKAIHERIFDESTFQEGVDGGVDLDDMRPPVGQMLSNLMDKEDGEPVRLGKTLEILAGSSPLSRYVSTISQMSDDRKGILGRFVAPMTGLRVTSVSPERQDAVLRERAEQYLQQIGARKFEKRYIPDGVYEAMSEEDKKVADKYMALIEVLGKRSKERRKVAQEQTKGLIDG